MPSSYRIDTGTNTAYSRAWGTVTDDEFLAHQRAISADPRFRRDMRQLLDGRGITEVKVTIPGIHKLIAGNPYGKGARRALVSGSEVVYGMSRVFELGRVTPEDEFRVFRALDEALTWLGLPLGEPPASPADWSSES